MTCGARGENFVEDVFGLSVDDVVIAPKQALSNQWVDPYRSWKEKVRFILRDDARTVKLVVGRPASGRTAEILLPGDQLAKWGAAQ